MPPVGVVAVDAMVEGDLVAVGDQLNSPTVKSPFVSLRTVLLATSITQRCDWR